MCIFEFCQKDETRITPAPNGQWQRDKKGYPFMKRRPVNGLQ
jgi:hypothetical protein